jgi:polar amino acid transport system permease protein
VSVERGQTEAALSMGMNYFQVMRRVVLPQALRLVIPPSTNFLIGLIKDTSLVLTIAVPEIMYRAYTVSSLTYQAIYVFAIAGAIYFAICFPLSRLALRLETRFAY